LKSDYKIKDSNLLKYAFLLLKNNDIKGFEKWLENYNRNVHSDIYDYVHGVDIRKKMYYDSSIVIVENESVLNTVESEICPSVNKNNIFFASTRKNLTGSVGNNYYNIFSASYGKGGQLGKLNTFNKSLNSGLNESSVYFSDNTNSMYFTRSSLANTDLKSYIANIPTNINDILKINEFTMEGFGSIGHISFNSKGTKMYFVSDAPVGSGGFDIYSCDLVNGAWSKPISLGANINSGKDEMYPFILNDSILYFTSDGHDGFGGLDLFSVNLNQKNSAPKNLGSKVNSEYDEFSLSFSPGGLTGYFSSNRPGGFGKEDIYRLHYLNLKIKHAYLYERRKYEPEEKKIILYLSDGKEYNISSEQNTGFNFGFLPHEAYKMVIQHENPMATDVINNDQLTAKEREKAFLVPNPFEKTDIDLELGMRYQFTVGMEPISEEYKNALNDLSKDYQNDNSSIIDLTALAKELILSEGELYTIRFEKDRSQNSDKKSKEITSLYINDQIIDVEGRSFFFVLPLDIEANFNIITDIDHFKETFNPKKTGKVKVDEKPVLKEKPLEQLEGFPILINTESFSDAPEGIFAKNFSVISGTFYMLTLTKYFPGTDERLELFVPLTKGVKYNFGDETQTENQYNKALSQIKTGQERNNVTDEELIDILIISKEMDISPNDSILYTLLPIKSKGSQTTQEKDVQSVLDVDGKKYIFNSDQKIQLKLLLEENKKVNIQTDLNFVKENFEPSTIALKVDNSSFSINIEEESKNINTDPVFDVIVVKFDLNKYDIRPDSKSILEEKVVQVLNEDERLYVTIKGYTDPLGNADYNKKLSENRAQEVKNFLASNGIGENRIRTFSFGETQSLKYGVNWEDLSEEELQKHRKVEIKIYLPK
ncbi:OmpA family protein, partial [Bacteroidota bacterium]